MCQESQCDDQMANSRNLQESSSLYKNPSFPLFASHQYSCFQLSRVFVTVYTSQDNH